MEPDAIRSHRAFELPWYYALELAPGLFTPGPERLAVAQTRELLRYVDVEGGGPDGGGARCLDIGIQEGLVTILLERRGSSQAVGYDRILRDSRLELVQMALGTRFELVGGMKLQDLPGALRERNGGAEFDVVVFSGVLYHMFDPLGGLAIVRSFVREGGICVIETSAVFQDSDSMHFNRGGRFTPHALWFVTPRLLDYLLRFLRLEPVDVVYLEGKAEERDKRRRGRLAGVLGRGTAGAAGDGKPPQGRVAIACRAVSDPPAEPGDEWIQGKDYTVDFAEFLDWTAVASDAPAVGYEAPREGLIEREDGSVDVQASVAHTLPLPLDPELTRLTLDASY